MASYLDLGLPRFMRLTPGCVCEGWSRVLTKVGKTHYSMNWGAAHVKISQGLGWKAHHLSHLDAGAMNGGTLLWNPAPSSSFPQNLVSFQPVTSVVATGIGI